MSEPKHRQILGCKACGAPAGGEHHRHCRWIEREAYGVMSGWERKHEEAQARPFRSWHVSPEQIDAWVEANRLTPREVFADAKCLLSGAPVDTEEAA